MVVEPSERMAPLTKAERTAAEERRLRGYRGDPDPATNVHYHVERLVDQIESLLVPGEVAAEMLGLTRGRIFQMGDEGKLRYAYSLIFGLRMYAKEDVVNQAKARGMMD